MNNFIKIAVFGVLAVVFWFIADFCLGVLDDYPYRNQTIRNINLHRSGKLIFFHDSEKKKNDVFVGLVTNTNRDSVTIKLKKLESNRVSFSITSNFHYDKAIILSEDKFPFVVLCENCKSTMTIDNKYEILGIATQSANEFNKLFNENISFEFLKKSDYSPNLEKKEFNSVYHDSVFIDVRDNMQYKTIRIGNQIWMSDNMKFKTKNSEIDRNGNVIYPSTDTSEICPTDWHIATQQDFRNLDNYIFQNFGESYSLKNALSFLGFSVEPNFIALGERCHSLKCYKEISFEERIWVNSDEDCINYAKASISVLDSIKKIKPSLPKKEKNALTCRNTFVCSENHCTLHYDESNLFAVRCVKNNSKFLSSKKVWYRGGDTSYEEKIWSLYESGLLNHH